jgi:type IV pilus assembly protein PilO
MADLNLDKIFKLPLAQKVIILIAVNIILLGLFYYMFYESKLEESSTLQEELTKLQAKHAEQKKVIADLPKWRKENEELKVKFKELLKLLPNTKEIPSLLTNISYLAQDCGLEILLFQPQNEVVKGFYADIPVDMQVLGDYHNIGHFFDKVSKLKRIVNISDLTISTGKKKRTDSDKPKLNSKFKVITFKFIEKDTSSVKKKKKKRK